MVSDDPTCDPDNPVHVTLEDVKRAKELLGDSIVKTPCIKCHLSDQTYMDFYIKKEFLQYTGSFKERGARNAMMQLSPEQRKRGVIAVSAGNHAQALSYHGFQLGIPVTVVMPVTASVMKVEKCKKYKANVVLEGNGLGESKKVAMSMAKEKGLIYLNGYDNPDILAGAGTIGLEILDAVPDVDAIIIPVGGGGLLAGISTVVKNLSPKTTIIGVESESCPGMTRALEFGKPTEASCTQSLADGLSVPLVGFNSFETARRYMDKMVLVKEEMIAIAILALLEQEKCVVEGAGAVGLAAIMSGVLPELHGKKVVTILSGGNIDSSVLGRVLERGLAALGRLVKFTIQITDKTGGISDLLLQLGNIGVTVKDIQHERAWVINDVFSVNVTVICECRGIDHATDLKTFLDDSYKNVDFSYFPNVCAAKAIGL